MLERKEGTHSSCGKGDDQAIVRIFTREWAGAQENIKKRKKKDPKR